MLTVAVRLMAERHKGFDARGRFYNNKVDYYGVGVSFGF
jgi:hypothetical protein